MNNIIRVPIGFVEIATPIIDGYYRATVRVCGGDITFTVPGPFYSWEEAEIAARERAQVITYEELKAATIARNGRLYHANHL